MPVRGSGNDVTARDLKELIGSLTGRLEAEHGVMGVLIDHFQKRLTVVVNHATRESFPWYANGANIDVLDLPLHPKTLPGVRQAFHDEYVRIIECMGHVRQALDEIAAGCSNLSHIC